MEPSAEVCFDMTRMLDGKVWHAVRSTGDWNIAKMAADFADRMIYSISSDRNDPPDRVNVQYEDAIFRFSESLIVHLHSNYSHHGRETCIWARERKEAETKYAELRAKYCRKCGISRKAAKFFMIQTFNAQIESQRVQLRNDFPRGRESLDLHYGNGFSEWEANLVKSMKQKPSGVTILRGEPGTGKTSFIRHLISKLRRSHRFYYLPLQQSNLLTSPGMVHFWAEENEGKRPRRKKVIILEDSESLLLPRAADNREHLSDLLNISDGLLGEFLQMQIICTVNCDIDELDPAITRRGRLLAHRLFRRLDRAEASKLAMAKALQLPLQDTYAGGNLQHWQCAAL